MRTARIRLDQWEQAHYHCMGRVAGEPGHLPFGDVEKERLFTLLERLTVFHTVEVVSFVVMGNHWHLVCSARPEPPSLDETRSRWRAFYGSEAAEPPWEAPGVYERMAERMRDLSEMMKALQQQFTSWYNRTRPSTRRGTLWAGRFKSVLLEDGDALWECVKYVEMNPIRAGICARPEDYRFSSWGRFSGGGRHPFAANFFPLFRRLLGERAAAWDDTRIAAELGSSMARQAAAEAGADPEAVQATDARSLEHPRFRTTLMRRARYWIDGAVIGSKTFLREVEARFRDPSRPPKRFDRSDIVSIFSYRQLRI